MEKFDYIFEAFLPDGRRIVSWLYPSPQALIPQTIKIFGGGLINLIKTRQPEFKEMDIRIVVSLNGKEFKNEEAQKK